jgi:hypothetical protein
MYSGRHVAVSLEEVVVVPARSTGSLGYCATVSVGEGWRTMVLEEVVVEPSPSLSRPDPARDRATAAPHAATTCQEKRDA